MILTKDNLLRFVQRNKAVIPALVSEEFDTSTMIASAALSELAKEKLIAITHLKLSSSPYYYDPRQREFLIELGKKHFSKYEKDIFLKLQENEILSDNSLSIQESLAIERIKDFAIPIIINMNNNEVKFWVWYLRDIEQTKQQIMDAINPSTKNKNSISQETTSKTQIKKGSNKTNKLNKIEQIDREYDKYLNNNNSINNNNNNNNNSDIKTNNSNSSSTPSFNSNTTNTQKQSPPENDQIEMFIENFLQENYFKIESKNKEDKGILYSVNLQVNNIEIVMDCFYFYKKTNEAELIKFYTSSQTPKIIFLVNCPKKILKLSENIVNLTVINI